MRERWIIAASVPVLVIALLPGCLRWSVRAHSRAGETIQDDQFPGQPPDEFYAGNYSIIGQRPANGVAYKGRARIEIKDQHKIRLSRTINGRTTVVEGRFVSGGELKKKCLQFNWKDRHGRAEMFCQYSVDFDNYARLSCVWSYGKHANGRLPGFESYYPLAGLSKAGAARVFSKSSPPNESDDQL
jgi:hypothetical protein